MKYFFLASVFKINLILYITTIQCAGVVKCNGAIEVQNRLFFINVFVKHFPLKQKRLSVASLIKVFLF